MANNSQAAQAMPVNKKIILYRQGISFCFKKLENLSDNQKERLCLNGSKKIDARLF